VWATLIALTVDDVPRVGVVSAPALGRRWWAARGAGAWCTDARGPRRIAVSGVADLADAYASTTDARGLGERWARLGAAVWETRRSATSGSTACSPRARSTSPWTPPRTRGPGRARPDRRGGGRRAHRPARAPGFRGGDGLATNGLLHEAALRLVSAQQG
jgi:histidinol-phosphatase